MIEIPDLSYPPSLRCEKLSRVAYKKKKPLECFRLNPWQPLQGRHVSEAHHRRPFSETTDISVQLTFSPTSPLPLFTCCARTAEPHLDQWKKRVRGFRSMSRVDARLRPPRQQDGLVLFLFVFVFFLPERQKGRSGRYSRNGLEKSAT